MQTTRRSYQLTGDEGRRSAILIVGPAVYQPILFVGTVLFHDEKGDMKLSPYLGADSFEEALRLAREWTRKNLFATFTETPFREP